MRSVRPHRPQLPRKRSHQQRRRQAATLADTFAAFDPDAAAHRAAAAAFHDRLVGIGFGPDRAAKLFGLTEIADVRAARTAYYDAFVLARDAAGRAARFFVLHEAQGEDELSAWLGAGLIRFLDEMGAIVRVEAGWRSIVSATWFAGRLIVADARAYNVVWAGAPFPAYVMPPGGDSVGLYRVAPSTPRKATLDLCCGAGAQAIAAAGFSERVVGVDLNPRALRFARFNAAANRIGNASFVLGDCYEPLGEARFDAIVANPPFVPWPAEDPLLYRGGGPSGDEVVQRILAGAVGRLEPRGSLALVADLANAETLPARIRAWQGGARRTLIVLQNRYDLVAYAETHAAHIDARSEREDETLRLLRHFAAVGIASLDFGYIVQDGELGAAQTLRTAEATRGAIRDDVARWFAHQQRLAGEDIASLRLVLAPNVALVRESVVAGDGSRAELRQALPGPGSLQETTTLSERAFRLLEGIASSAVHVRDLSPDDARELGPLLASGLARLDAG